MAFEKYTGGDDGAPQEAINERVPHELQRLALKIHHLVEESVTGEIKVRKSGNGITYYPESTLPGSAFFHIQPNQYTTALYVHFDASAKECVDAAPIPDTMVPLADDSTSESFRQRLLVESPLEIHDALRTAVKQSYQQVTQ